MAILERKALDVEFWRIHWLDIGKAYRHIKKSLKVSEKGTSPENTIDAVMKVVNHALVTHSLKEKKFKNRSCEFNHPLFHIKSFARKVLSFSTGLEIILFFYRTEPEKEIIVLTNHTPRLAIAECLNYEFPVKIGTRLLEKIKATELLRSRIVGEPLKGSPRGEISRVNSPRFFEVLQGHIKPNAFILEFLPKSQTHFPSLKVAEGGISIEPKVELGQYPSLFQIFHTYINDIPIFLSNGSLELTEFECQHKGLFNLTNTCYLNATLQAIYFLKEIRLCIKKETQSLFKLLNNTLEQPTRLDLTLLRDKIFETMAGDKNKRHDAYMLMVHIFDMMRWSPIQPFTSFSYNLPGYSGKQSTQSSGRQINHLSLKPSPEESLQDLINGYFEPKEINEPFQTSDIEGQPLTVPSYKMIKGISLPELLVIHLKRFEKDNPKLTELVSFKFDDILNIQQRINDPVTHYRIVALINHHGNSIEFGHYTADVRELTADGQPWMHCDDERVTYQEPINPALDAEILFLEKLPNVPQ